MFKVNISTDTTDETKFFNNYYRALEFAKKHSAYQDVWYANICKGFDILWDFEDGEYI